MQDTEWTRRPLLSTFDGNNRQMLEGICDSLSHVRTVFIPQSNESILSPVSAPGIVYANTVNANHMHITTSESNPPSQKNSPVTVGLPAKVTSKMTRQNRGQYNERAMRKIRDDLTLFAHDPASPSSSLMNDVDSCVANKHLLQQLAARGYDESVASRALNLSGNKSVEAALEILQGLPLVENKNGINKTSYLYKLIRKPSFEEKYRQTQSSPVSISDSNSVRSDSPGSGPLNKPIFTQEPPHIIATQAVNMVSNKNRGQVTPNPMVNGHYTPPPLPPRVPIGMLHVMSHGHTPPPQTTGHLIASDQIPHSLSSQSLLKPTPAPTVTSTAHQQYHGAPPEHVQQLLKRMSPMQTDNMRAHGIVFSTPTFNNQHPQQQQQSSGPASGGIESMTSRPTTVSMPVAQGHQPIIMQNGQPQNMQNSAALSQHMQGLNLNSPSSSSTTSSNSNTAMGNVGSPRVTIKYTHPHTQPPPPYPHNNNTPSRRSPIGIQIRPNTDHSSAMQRQARGGQGNQRAEYDTRITISSSSKLGEQEDSPGESITVNIPAKRTTPSPVPMHAWGAKHGTIIMQSVTSREVAKPVPQTATVPASPAQQSAGGPLNSQSPSPNFVSCVQTQVNALSPSSRPLQYTQIHQHPTSQYQPALIQQHVKKLNQNAPSNVQIQIRHEPKNQGAINVMPDRGANKPHVDIRNPHVGISGPQPASIHIQIQKQPRHYAPVFSTPTIDSYNRVAIEVPSSTPRSDSPVSRTTNQSPMSILSTTSTTTSTNSDIVPDRPPPPYPGPGRAVNIDSPLSACQPPLPPRVPLSSQVIGKHPLPLPISGMCTIPSSTQPYSSSTVTSCTLEQDEHSDLEVQSLDQDSSTTTDEQTESTTTDEQIENSVGGDFEMASCQKKHRCTSPIPERKPEAKKNDYLRHDCTVKNLSPDAFKFFMEQHVENLLKSHQQRLHRRLQLESEMAKVGLSHEDQCQMRRMLNQKESNYIRLKRAKMDKSLFKRIKTLGIGAFGEVTLVRKKDVGHLHAMKTLRKSDVLQRNQVAHVKAERDILAEADNEWVVKLYYSFQDENNLYFVMDYVPGGDLMGLLIRLGIFEEDLARFYVAELVLAIESVHKMGFIHRDIKPDNVLIDRDGHIKLTDFGLCTGFRWTHNSKYYQKDLIHGRQDSMDVSCGQGHIECNCAVLKPLERRRQRDHQRCLAHSLVGTPNYIAPEVLNREGYTSCCDWWSVGVILYEMLVGQPPFYAPTPAETQYKVIHWIDTLRIPSEPHLSAPAADLITKLCRNPEHRLGANGFSEIKQHKFFSQMAFEGLRRQQAPYVPTILYPTDTSNFDAVDPERCRGSDSDSDESTKKDIYENGKHPEHAFYEFTFRRFFDDGGHPYPQVKDPESNAPVYV